MNISTVHVALDDRSYDIAIANGILSHAGEITRRALGQKVRKLALISNPKVYPLFGKIVEKSLKKADFLTLTHLMNDGERAKNLKTAEQVWSFLLANHFERGDAIVALGGGVVGDLAGFVAACFQRGIEFIQIPTTLLAQIDSSVGGKTAVNHPLGKNMIGAFHQPKAVIIDPGVLQTLPPRELRAGLFEAIKHGVIRDASVFELIGNNRTKIAALDAEVMSEIVRRNCEIKVSVVAADEREKGLRRILNYGHNIGHALEAVTHYRRLNHGEAIGYGMKAEANLAKKIGVLSNENYVRICAVVDSFGSLPSIKDLNVAEIMAAMAHDKKASQGKLPFILPTKIGEVIIRDDLEAKVIRASIKELL